jgi:CrcB protein
MKALLLVGLGGFLGAVTRWQLGGWIDRLGTSGSEEQAVKFPLGIFVVNGIGCLLIGLLFGWFSTREGFNESWRMFAAVGFLGAFTTFSTFSHNTLTLFHDGQANLAFANILASVVVGMLAVWAGYSIAK